MISFFQIETGGFDSNFSYILHAGNGDAALVDPCGDFSLIRKQIQKLSSLRNKKILITHAHPDHIDALTEAKHFFPAECCSANPGLAPDILLKDGMIFPFGEDQIRCMATPGHSQDSFCFYLPDSKLLITGDTLFVEYIGFGRPALLFESLKKLAALPDDVQILSGHNYGSTPVSTIGEQKKRNPFFRTDSLEEFRKQMRKLC